MKRAGGGGGGKVGMKKGQIDNNIGIKISIIINTYKTITNTINLKMNKLIETN